jgi:TRAP-type mannitol/chloroaromatic compound transport system permease small subunit
MLDKFFGTYHNLLGNITATLMLLVMSNVFLDVILRYFFHTGSIGLQEMEWHLFAIMFLFGISYALNDEAHVRVDFIYDSLNNRKKAMINIIGTIFMLLPFALLIIYVSYDFIYDSFIVQEISGDPGGLPYRWIIKFMIPLAFISLVISSFGYIYKNIKVLYK